MGCWWIEKEMETIDENVWLYKFKYIVLFKIASILTNFLHKCWMDFTFEIRNKKILNCTNYG
jgi:hypothetical protein